MNKSPSIIYTWTDEGPALATFAFLPIIRSFAGATGVPVETRDISLAGRILAVFPDVLDEDQKVSDDLAELGDPGGGTGGQRHQAARTSAPPSLR